MTYSAAHPATPSRKPKLAIEDASAWILRIGVILSVLVMLAGLILTFSHHTAGIERMQQSPFDASPRDIWQGLIHLHGKAVIEIGVYLLVLTPIARVAMLTMLFIVEERDWLFAAVTFIVLLLTLGGLLLLK